MDFFKVISAVAVLLLTIIVGFASVGYLVATGYVFVRYLGA